MEKLSLRFPSRRTVGVTVVVAALSAGLSSLSTPAALRIDGQRTISDVPPVTTAKGAYVPLRVVAETLGADTNYDAKTGTIELTHANGTLRLRVGDRAAILNGKKLTLKSAPFAVRGRTMVSLNVIARALKTNVSYDVSHAKIDVMTPGMIEPGAQDETP